MLWWKSNPIKIQKKADGKTSIAIGKSVTPLEYLEFVRSLLQDVALSNACQLLTKNGQPNPEQQMMEDIFQKDLEMTQGILSAAGLLKSQQQAKGDEEIIKPLTGLMGNMKDRLVEAEYNVDGNTLHHSGFNLEWFAELGIYPQLIVDVGAYDFGDSIRFKMEFPTAQVVGFELDKRNYAKFSEFAKTRGIEVENLAVSDSNSEISGYYESKHDGGVNAQSTLLKPTDRYTFNYPYVKHNFVDSPISQIRLDGYFDQHTKIDLLHIDVEGAEYLVLSGLGELRPILIWLEYLIDGGWEGCRFADVDKFLIDNGYKMILNAGADKLWQYQT